MGGHEVTAVDEAALNGLRPAPLHTQILSDVVASVAVGLRVTGLAQPPLLRGLRAVMTHEPTLMAQESLRQQALQVTIRVTGCALPGSPSVAFPAWRYEALLECLFDARLMG